MCDIPQTNTEFRIQNIHLHDLQRKSIQRDFVISWIPKKYLVASLSIILFGRMVKEGGDLHMQMTTRIMLIVYDDVV